MNWIYKIIFGCSILVQVRSDLIVKTVGLVEGEGIYLLTNGSVAKGNKGGLTPCGIGKGVIFVEDELGECHKESDMSLKRGTINQVSNDQNRNNYVGSEYTVIDERIADNFDPVLRKCILNSMVKGKNVVTGDFRVTGNYTANQFGVVTVITMYNGTLLEVLNQQTWCCSCTQGGCGLRFQAGNTREIVSCSTGIGSQAFYYNNNQECTGTEGVCLKGNRDGYEAYLPTVYSKPDGKIMAMTYSTFLLGDFQTREWNSTKLERSPVKRKKRFVEYIALALAISDQVQIGILFGAVTEGFATTDRNDRKLFSELVVHQNEIKDNARDIMNNDLRMIQTDDNLRTLNENSNRYQEILLALSIQVDSIVGYVLFLSNFVMYGSGVTDLAVQTQIEKFSKENPDYQIISSSKGLSSLTIFAFKGNIITGTAETQYCDGSNCQLVGSWFHYQSEGVTTTERDPYLTIGTCGVYFQTDSTDLIYAITYAKSFENAVSLCVQAGIQYAYVLKAKCYIVQESGNLLMSGLNDAIERIGARVNMTADQKYLIDCSNVQTNESLKIMANFGLICGVINDADKIRTAYEKFRVIDWKLESALANFQAAGGDIVGAITDIFTGLGEGIGGFFNGIIGSLFSFSTSTILIVCLIVVVALDTIAILVLLRKVFMISSSQIVLADRTDKVERGDQDGI